MSLLSPTNVRLLTAGVYPTGSSGSYSTAARARIAWDHNPVGSTGTITFRVQVDDGAFTFTTAGTTTLHELDVTGLPIHVLRHFRVRAETVADGNSLYEQEDIMTSDPLPTSGADVPDVVNLQCALVTDTSVLLTWEYAGYVTTLVTIAVESSDGGAGESSGTTGLEKSCTISGLTPGKHYTFNVATFGIFAANTTTINSYGGTTVFAFALMAEVDDVAPISGPSVLSLELGMPATAQWNYIGSGQADLWTLQGAPEGVDATLDLPTLDKRLAQLDGAPTSQGVYQATVNVRSVIGLVRSSASYPVRMIVTGIGVGSCLSWFHDDPTRVDLQLNTRTRKVKSWAMATSDGDPSAQLLLMRGDTQRVHIITRDDGGNMITTAPTILGINVRPKNRRDGPILLGVYSTTPSSETINGHTVYYVDLVPTGVLLDRIFENLNRNPLADAGGNSIECDGEIVIKLTGGPGRTSLPFPVFISQDTDR